MSSQSSHLIHRLLLHCRLFRRRPERTHVYHHCESAALYAEGKGALCCTPGLHQFELVM